jgi:hypothetical protein
MPKATVKIRLVDRACALALEPRRAGGAALHPLARVLLENSEPGAAGARVVVCTLPEARALLDHFAGLTSTLAGLGDPDAGVGADARDSIRRAIGAAGMQ